MHPAVIDSHQPEYRHQACIARVVDVSEGRARRVRCEYGNQTLWPVVAHAQMLPELQIDDRVLVVMTADGAVVTQVLLDDDGGPARRLTLQAAHGLVIRCGGSRIELSADGGIRVSGDMIHQQADGRMVLRGGRVELN